MEEELEGSNAKISMAAAQGVSETNYFHSYCIFYDSFCDLNMVLCQKILFQIVYSCMYRHFYVSVFV